MGSNGGDEGNFIEPRRKLLLSGLDCSMIIYKGVKRVTIPKEIKTNSYLGKNAFRISSVSNFLYAFMGIP